MAHELVSGRTICLRHRGYMTMIGQDCSCGFWACACGHVFYEHRTRVLDFELLDASFEGHLALVGAPLPTVDETYAELKAFNEAERVRRQQIIWARMRLAQRLMRAQLRENKNSEELTDV